MSSSLVSRVDLACHPILPKAAAPCHGDDDVDGDWDVLDPKDARTLPVYQFDLEIPYRRAAEMPPAWIDHLQPLLPPTVAASAVGIHRQLQSQAVWAVPLARRATAAGVVLGTQALRGANHVATVGPPEAQRLAGRAWQMSYEFADTLQDQMRWFWFSTQERRVAQAWYDWLEDKEYIIDGQLESPPKVEMITEREGVRRVSTLRYISLRQWQQYCAAMQAHDGPLTPWGLAALMRHAQSI